MRAIFSWIPFFLNDFLAFHSRTKEWVTGNRPIETRSPDPTHSSTCALLSLVDFSVRVIEMVLFEMQFFDGPFNMHIFKHPFMRFTSMLTMALYICTRCSIVRILVHKKKMIWETEKCTNSTIKCNWMTLYFPGYTS